jgi:hypothetical protein
MYFLWPRGQGWPDGTWVIDPESLVEAVKKDSSKAANLGAEQEKLLVGLMAVALKDFQLRIDGTKATAQGTMMGRPIPEKDRDSTLRALGSGRYEMRSDRTGELATLTLRNGRLELQEVTGKGKDVTLVLRRN